MSKIKLAFLIGQYGTGGKEKQLTEIIQQMPKDRYEIFLFMKNDTSYLFNTINCDLTSYYSLNKDNFNLFDIFELKRFFISTKPDTVFSLSKILSHFSLLLKYIFLFEYRLINGSIRDAPLHLSPYMKFEKRMYSIYNEVVANSKAGLNAYNQAGKKGRYVLYNGFVSNRIPKSSISQLKQKLKIDGRFMIVMVASMGETKDQITFIHAAREVLLIDANTQFFLIGDGLKKSQYKRLVKSLNIRKNVFFTGEVDNVESYLKVADLSVLTSSPWHGEGISNSVMESMACGTPVIASDNGGTKEIIEDGVNGFLIQSGDYQSLASKILLLIQDSDLRMKFSSNSRNKIKSKFSINKTINKFDEIIKIND